MLAGLLVAGEADAAQAVAGVTGRQDGEDGQQDDRRGQGHGRFHAQSVRPGADDLLGDGVILRPGLVCIYFSTSDKPAFHLRHCHHYMSFTLLTVIGMPSLGLAPNAVLWNALSPNTKSQLVHGTLGLRFGCRSAHLKS